MSPERLCSESGESKGLLRYVGGDSRTPLGDSVSLSESLRVIQALRKYPASSASPQSRLIATFSSTLRFTYHGISLKMADA